MDEEILRKIQELLPDFQGSLSIIEDQIDIGVQIEYLERVKKIRKESVELNIEEISKKLYSDDLSITEKKDLLVLLAGQNDPSAYREIEKFIKEGDEKLTVWAKMALNDIRFSLESYFLEEGKIIISTGLGGKDMKLRYFIVLRKNKDEEFGDFQKSVVQREVNIAFDKNNCELEQISFEKKFVLITALLPLEAGIRDVFAEIIAESNQYGDFLNNSFMATNYSILSVDEIEDFFAKDNKDQHEDNEENKG